MITSSTMVRVLTLISGAVAIVLANLGTFALATSTRNVITAIGGIMIAVLAYLEHPTTQTAASTKQAVQTQSVKAPTNAG